ncbi:MAG: hypothetical protein DRG09_02485 [Epsilonproteobacteria bacterium]|nr:MAG: hypothetical protein DRG09_02485 [Campylobacterota bacterium]
MRIILMMTVALSIAMAETTMVKDPTTNLIWEDTTHTSEDKITFDEAKTYCETLKITEVSGWRLPTLNELLTIVDYTRADPAILKEFNHVKSGTVYWASTPYVRSRDEFWGVDFKDGTTDGTSRNYSRYVRCVKAVK